MPTRSKLGRLRVTSKPQTRAEGRSAPLAVVARVGSRELGGAFALLDAMLALASVDEPPRRLRRRVKDLAYRMTSRGEGALAGAVRAAFTRDGGAFLRMVATSHPDFREPLYGAARQFLLVRHEHDIRSAAADAELLRSCMESAMSMALAARVARDGFGEGTADLLKVVTSVGSAARLDLHSAMVLGAKSQALASRPVEDDREKRLREYRRQQELNAQLPDEPDSEEEESEP